MATKTHRVRRGKVVEIPEEWRGKTISKQTRTKRPANQRRKDVVALSPGDSWHSNAGHPRTWAPRHTRGVRSEEGDEG